MNKTLSVLAAITLTACGTSDSKPVTTGKAVDPTASGQPAAAKAPSEDEVLFFLEAWLPQVAKRSDEAARALSSSAVIDIAGCTDGKACLSRIDQLAGVVQALALGDAKVEAHGDRARISLSVEDIVIGNLDLELRHGADGLVVERVSARWSNGSTATATPALVEQWLADVRAGAASAEAVLQGADIAVNGHACGKTPACAGRALETIRKAQKIANPTTSMRVVDRARLRYDLPEALASWRAGSDDVTWISWSAEFDDLDFESSEAMLAVKRGPDAELRIVAASVSIQEVPDIDH